jgi:L-threonylcarbamoyladenylate synthase
MNNERYDAEDLKKAIEVLRAGGVILYPTDTIWGLGCDAQNEAAVKKIYDIKQRTDQKSLLILVDEPQRLEYYVNEVPEIAWDLIEASDRPMTIIYPNAKNLASNLIALDGSIGIRVCNEPFCHTLISRFRNAIVSTSANISGQNSPSFFDEIDPMILKNVDYVVQYRQNDRTPHKASSIIKLGLGGQFEIIRP